MFSNHSDVTDKINHEIAKLLNSNKIQNLFLNSFEKPSLENKNESSSKSEKIILNDLNSSEQIFKKSEKVIELHQNNISQNITQYNQFNIQKNPFQPSIILNKSPKINKNFYSNYNFIGQNPHMTICIDENQKNLDLENLKNNYPDSFQQIHPFSNYLNYLVKQTYPQIQQLPSFENQMISNYYNQMNLNQCLNKSYIQRPKIREQSNKLKKRIETSRTEEYRNDSNEKFKSRNLETSIFLKKNLRKNLFSYKTYEISEKKIILNVSNKIKNFWKKFNNSYPFAFKLNRLEKTNNSEIPLLLIEKYQYNSKQTNSNNSNL